MVKFIHTADWQLGMTRHFLAPAAQALYSEARLDSLVEIGRLAREEGCAFVVVSGDVFESNHVHRDVVVRALEALRSFDVPVYLLPGNHDPINAGSVYRSAMFTRNCPEHVVVLESGGAVRAEGTEVDVIGAPWETKQPLEDLVARACSSLEPDERRMRVVVGHGAVDRTSPDPNSPSLIRLQPLESSIRSGCIHYVALGDRHSVTDVGSTGRIWYSGTPVVTDFDEVEPNHVLVVDMDREKIAVERRRIGNWAFVRRSLDVNSLRDVDAAREWLDGVADKRRTVVKLSFVGTLSLADKAALDSTLAHFDDLFAALDYWERHMDLCITPDEGDLSDLGLSGFAAATMQELTRLAVSGGQQTGTAQDALGLLFRLSGAQR
ncbi:MAG: DNA repair exonuclease [Actinomycetota bacterium]|nr:DNA repair exonuclease [Actinomycetota bacterium]